MHEYQGPDRRRAPSLSDEQIDLIAERAAEKALEKVYGEVGKALVKKLAWLAGAAVIALALWLTRKGIDLT